MEDKKLYELLKKMTLEEKIGQILLVRYNEENVIEKIQKLKNIEQN